MLINIQQSSVAVYAIVDDPSTIMLCPPHSGSSRHTVFLPLFRSLPNSSFSGDVNYRRRLQNDTDHLPNSRMDLHDGLLVNGYYSTRLWIGSPPQRFALIVDTGSSVTYVPCSTCKQCGTHQDPWFDPESSSTYEPVKCNTKCLCGNDKKQCIYERQYAEKSSSSGVLGEDIISFGYQSDLSPQRATFGCENKETGDIYRQHADGIMGLGRGDLSLVDQLVDKGVISDSFSLCYGGMDVGGGAMVLGGISPPPGMVYTYSNPIRSPYYNVELEELHVAGKRLHLNPDVFNGKHGTVLDSGTTYAYLPEEAFLVFKDAIMKELHFLKQIDGPDRNYNDICFSGAGSDATTLSDTFPSVDMVFGEGHKLSLSPENYLFRHSTIDGAYCLGIFQNGKDPSTLLGAIIGRNMFVMYDRENDKIGFWKTNCSELWARLHSSDSPPSSSNGSRPSPNYPSPPAPMKKPYHISPGSKVANIIFVMSLNIGYSKLEPQITELKQYIAMELDVHISQVNLVDFTSVGNASLTIWSITPLQPAEYMSNPFASHIITRIADDEIYLPRRFGTHRISNWFIESVPNRTWWQKNWVTVIILILVLTFVCAAVYSMWYWRHTHPNRGPYRPVGICGMCEQLNILKSDKVVEKQQSKDDDRHQSVQISTKNLPLVGRPSSGDLFPLIPLLEVLVKKITTFLQLSFQDNKYSDIVNVIKYYITFEEVLKIIKPVIESIIYAEVASNESLQKEFEGMSMSQFVNELRVVLESSPLLICKVYYFVLKVGSLFEKVQTHDMELLELLQSCEELPVELSLPSHTDI
ncbi:aspartic proteinase-like protein 1 [Rutidosis leptorrhynchoides]|uniref:aspartic proteinase-like protein 1 n=1 Tax=Rutidosis leptorrhynchoides TaxID=125765 RepID=UPI003A997393